MTRPVRNVREAAGTVAFLKMFRQRLDGMVDGDADDQLIKDTMEGAPADLDGAMTALFKASKEAEALCKAHREIAKGYAEAAQADEARSDKLRQLALDCLQAAELDGWKGDVGTVSVLEGSWSVEIRNASHVPYEWHAPSVPAKGRIKEELEALRKELEAMNDSQLIKATENEGEEVPESITIAARTQALSEPARYLLINRCLAKRIPGAALVKGPDTIALRLPRGKKGE